VSDPGTRGSIGSFRHTLPITIRNDKGVPQPVQRDPTARVANPPPSHLTCGYGDIIAIARRGLPARPDSQTFE
jgi:hypothetical protein